MSEPITISIKLDFTGASQQTVDAVVNSVKKLGVAGDSTSGSTDKLGKSVDDASNSYKGFFREQRLQDRIMGEGKQSILGIASALSLVTSSQNNASVSMKRVESGLITFITMANAGEFALFSLAKMGSKMSGALGTISMSIGRHAGPISMVVGLGAGLIAFFKDANAEAFENKGLDDFKSKLESISQKMLAMGTKELREQLALQSDYIANIEKQLELAKKDANDPWKVLKILLQHYRRRRG